MIGWILGLLGFATYPRREYDVYAVLGDPDSQPIWTWDRWIRDVVPMLDPIVGAGRGKPLVSTTQYVGRKPTSRDFLKFDRLGWTMESHSKWVHGSPANIKQCEDWTLLDAQVTVPGVQQCEREDLPPDVYFGFANYSLQRLVNPVIVLAVAADLSGHLLSECATASHGLSEITNASVAAYQRRPWGIKSGRVFVGYENMVDNLIAQSLLKPGWHEQESVEFGMLEGSWENINQRT